MSLPIGNLNIDLTQTDTSFPALAVGDYRTEIKKTEFKESTKTPGLWQFIVTVALLEPATDVKGKTVNPGFELNARLTLPGGPGVPPEHEEMRMKQLATFIDAVFNNEDQATRPAFDEATINALPTKQVIIVVKKNKDTDYGETDIKSFKPVIA